MSDRRGAIRLAFSPDILNWLSPETWAFFVPDPQILTDLRPWIGLTTEIVRNEEFISHDVIRLFRVNEDCFDVVN